MYIADFVIYMMIIYNCYSFHIINKVYNLAA